jgi:hypothetical protein
LSRLWPSPTRSCRSWAPSFRFWNKKKINNHLSVYGDHRKMSMVADNFFTKVRCRSFVKCRQNSAKFWLL